MSNTAKTKADAAPKKDAAASTDAPKTANSTSSDAAPANYSRGEGQKVVTQAYRDNWDAIFAKPKAKKARTGAHRAKKMSRSKRARGR
jgi:hypothetical protein